jgi:GNAT superfamily N-acetyltransferase
MAASSKKMHQNYRNIEWLREAFFEFTPKALYGADFRPWYTMGGWNDRYIPYSFVDQTTMLANVSISTMELLINGKKKRGIQFATVGTLPEYRNQGLARELMEQVLAAYEASTDLFFLFANDTVLDFYPKFGFTRVEETIFSAAVSSITPQVKARKLNVATIADRKLIENLVEERMPVTEVFGALDYWHILLFYLPHYSLWYLEQEHVLVIATIEEGSLHVYDIISKQAFSFRQILPFIVEKPVSTVYFYFTPDKIDLPALPSHPYSESPLFVRGEFPLKGQPFKFPLLAQT